MVLLVLSPLPVTLPMPPPHVASKFMTYSLVNVFYVYSPICMEIQPTKSIECCLCV